MTEFEKELLSRIDRIEDKLDSKIDNLRTEVKEELQLVWAAQNKTSEGLALFKGKALGLLPIVSAIFNYAFQWWNNK